MAKLYPKASYGINNGNYIHGLSGHPLYSIWLCMRQRCYYKKHNRYQNYGGRGIIVCDKWIDTPVEFIDWALRKGWKKGLQIDRENNNGNYCSRRAVTTNTPQHQWTAYIYINRLRKHIGCFLSAYAAAIERDEYIKKHNLQHKLNFGGGKAYESFA